MKFFLLLMALAAHAADEPKAGIYIDVGEAKIKQSVVAFPPLVDLSTPLPAPSTSGKTAPLTPSKKAVKPGVDASQTIYKTVLNDLTVTGLFLFIKPEAYLEDPAGKSIQPKATDPANGFDFAPWKSSGTEFLIRGGYRVVSGGNIQLQINLYYVPQAKLLLGRTYEGSFDAGRRVAHTFANDLIKALTNKPGMFLSKVAVSSDRSNPAQKEIFVMDWDAENFKQITQHQSLAISPAWSSDGKKVAYTAFAYHKNAQARNADLFVYELATGKRFLVSYRKGINSGAAFSPDNKYLYLTISQNGTPDIFRMTPDGTGLSQLTSGPNGAMNVEPAISPDGKWIAFSSDRSGRPMIYVMGIDGGSARRITFAGKYNSTPTWSADGKVLAFAGYESNHFDIFTINVDGTGLKRLTEATRVDTQRPATNEDPTWSPDGRHIMFISDRSGSKQLFMINPDGTNERRLTYDKANYFKPKWSGLEN